MVADLLIVYERFAGLDLPFQKGWDIFPVGADIAGGQPFFQRRYNICADVSGIRSGIGQDLVVLVEPLHDIQGFLGGEAKALVGVSLQFCQVVKTWRKGFLLLFLYVAYGKRLSLQRSFQILDEGFLERTGAAALLMFPGPGDAAGHAGQSVVFFWAESAVPDPPLPCPSLPYGRMSSLSAFPLVPSDQPLCSASTVSACYPCAPTFSLNTLALAYVIMLFLNPFHLFDISFQMSFSRRGFHLMFYPPLFDLLKSHGKIIRSLWGLFSVSLAAQIGTLPLIVYYFGRISCYSLLTSFIAIPGQPPLIPLSFGGPYSCCFLPFTYISSLASVASG